MNQQAISMIFVSAALSAAVGQILGGFVSDAKGRRMACQMGLFVLALSTTMLLGRYPPAILFVILMFIAAGWTMGHTGISAVLTDLPDHFRPEIASLNSSVRFVAGGMGLFLSGFFVEYDFYITFFLIGILMWPLTLLLNNITHDKKVLD